MDFSPLKPYVSKGHSDLGQSSSSLSSPSPADPCYHHPGSNAHAARQHGFRSEKRGYTTGAEIKRWWTENQILIFLKLIQSINKNNLEVEFGILKIISRENNLFYLKYGWRNSRIKTLFVHHMFNKSAKLVFLQQLYYFSTHQLLFSLPVSSSFDLRGAPEALRDPWLARPDLNDPFWRARPHDLH